MSADHRFSHTNMCDPTIFAIDVGQGGRERSEVLADGIFFFRGMGGAGRRLLLDWDERFGHALLLWLSTVVVVGSVVVVPVVAE